MINIFSPPEETGISASSLTNSAGVAVGGTSVSIPSSALIIANTEGELPYRIERDETLQNQKIMTQTDFKCPLSDYDVHRMTTLENRNKKDDDTLMKIKQQMEEIGNGLNTKTGDPTHSTFISSSYNARIHVHFFSPCSPPPLLLFLPLLFTTQQPQICRKNRILWSVFCGLIIIKNAKEVIAVINLALTLV